jgi:hypothetical protein
VERLGVPTNEIPLSVWLALVEEFSIAELRDAAAWMEFVWNAKPKGEIH